MNIQSHKNYATTLILTIVLGWMGIHRFYVGKAGTGILYLLTFGFLGIGWIIDIIMVASGSFTDKSGAWIKPGSQTTPAMTGTPGFDSSGPTESPLAQGAAPAESSASTHPATPSSASTMSSQPPSDTARGLAHHETATAEKPFDTRWWFITIAVIVVLGVLSSLAGGDDEGDSGASSVEQSEPAPSDQGDAEADNDTSPRQTEPEPESAEADESEAEESEPERSDETTGQANARESAESYLRFSAFSRTGLIDQLEFEGYSTDDATYAVDAVQADWNEQALRSAQSYLDFSAFSRTGLIDQLEFEGFTTEEATFGVDQVGADWNEQAALSAQSYLEFSSFSRQGLIDQLVFEGFSQEEAEYGVAQAGY